MAFVDLTGFASGGTRRARIGCPHCGVPTELGKLRDHLRSEHGLGSTQLDHQFVDALIDVRRSRRSRA